jgi:hypothetical protein
MAALAAPSLPLASPRALDARITRVLGQPTRAGLSWPHRIALAAWVVAALGGARSAEARNEVCAYTPQLAAQLMLSHPEADLDGDGVLSREEACELAAELSNSSEPLDAQARTLLAEPSCCNSTGFGEVSGRDATCKQGVAQ